MQKLKARCMEQHWSHRGLISSVLVYQKWGLSSNTSSDISIKTKFERIFLWRLRIFGKNSESKQNWHKKFFKNLSFECNFKLYVMLLMYEIKARN